jgi:hypothetical protein
MYASDLSLRIAFEWIDSSSYFSGQLSISSGVIKKGLFHPSIVNMFDLIAIIGH